MGLTARAFKCPPRRYGTIHPIKRLKTIGDINDFGNIVIIK
jgi:hypothetical protein